MLCSVDGNIQRARLKRCADQSFAHCHISCLSETSLRCVFGKYLVVLRAGFEQTLLDGELQQLVILVTHAPRVMSTNITWWQRERVSQVTGNVLGEQSETIVSCHVDQCHLVAKSTQRVR